MGRAASAPKIMYNAKPKIELPYEFTSPYPPDECAERLQMKHGNYLGTNIEVQIKAQEYKGYRFQMQVYRDSDGYRPAVNLRLVGWLENVKNVGTRVVLGQPKPRFWTNIKEFIGVVVAAVFLSGMLIWALTNQMPERLGWLIAVCLTIVLIVSVRLPGSNAGLDQVVQLIEDTLTPQPESTAYEDNSLQAKVTRLKDVFHVEKPKRGH
jgi:hypothetical protein